MMRKNWVSSQEELSLMSSANRHQVDGFHNYTILKKDNNAIEHSWQLPS